MSLKLASTTSVLPSPASFCSTFSVKSLAGKKCRASDSFTGGYSGAPPPPKPDDIPNMLTTSSGRLLWTVSLTLPEPSDCSVRLSSTWKQPHRNTAANTVIHPLKVFMVPPRSERFADLSRSEEHTSELQSLRH